MVVMESQRRLVAILAADVVGYSRLMETHEEETYRRLMRLQSEAVNPCVAAQQGQVVKGFLAIFNSARDATRCALTLQQMVTTQTADQPSPQQIIFRMAVNAADIIVENNDIYGDGVNVAARLQSYAPPGGIVVSGAIAEQIGTDFGIGMIDLGDLHLRNLGRPVRVFALRMPMARSCPRGCSGSALRG
jgi:adenylate cyclase